MTEDNPAGTTGDVDVPQLTMMTSTIHTTYLVDINNYALGLRGRRLGDLFSSPTAGAGNYDGSAGTTKVLYAGGAAYGSSPEAVFFYDPRGIGQSFRPWASSLRPGQAVEVFEPGPFADNQTVTVMLELVEGQGEPRLPLGLVAVRETFAWTSLPDDDYVIVKYTLVNPHREDVTGLHLGQILDIDLGSDANNDLVAFDATNGLAYATTSETSVISGHVMLSGAAQSYQRWRNSSADPPELLPEDPATLAGWYGLLTGGMASAAAWGPSDIRHLLAEGPVTLEAKGSRSMAFALVAGDDMTDFLANAAAARAKWSSLPATATGPYSSPLTEVSVVPRTLRADGPGAFIAMLEFESSEVAGMFDADQAFCSGASPQRIVGVSGQRVKMLFARDDLPSELPPGVPIMCYGLLTDGTFYWAPDAPTLVYGEPG